MKEDIHGIQALAKTYMKGYVSLFSDYDIWLRRYLKDI